MTPRARIFWKAPLPFRLTSSMVRRAYPSFSTRLPSSPRRLPTKRISFRGSRSLNVSARARAGNRCPPVPPPAINIFISLSDPLRRKVQEDAHGQQIHHQGGSAEADERQGGSFCREQPHHHPHIQQRLDGQKAGNSQGQISPKKIRRPET